MPGTAAKQSGKSKFGLRQFAGSHEITLTLGMLLSYDAMGLMSTANPRMAGGLAPLPVAPFVERQKAEAEAIGAPQAQEALSAGESSGAAQSSSAKVPKGYARLIRDEQGNVVDVEFADEDEEQEEADPDAATPWGTPLDAADKDSKPVNLPADQGIRRSQGIPMPDSVTGDGIHVPHKPRPAPTPVVQGATACLASGARLS